MNTDQIGDSDSVAVQSSSRYQPEDFRAQQRRNAENAFIDQIGDSDSVAVQSSARYQPEDFRAQQRRNDANAYIDQIGDSDSAAVQSSARYRPEDPRGHQRRNAANAKTDLETESSDYFYSTEASVTDGRRAAGDRMRRAGGEAARRHYDEALTRQKTGQPQDVLDGPVGLDDFMSLLRAKDILPSLVTEAEALDAFDRHASRMADGGGRFEHRLGVEECKLAVKDLLASKNMLSRHVRQEESSRARCG